MESVVEETEDQCFNLSIEFVQFHINDDIQKGCIGTDFNTRGGDASSVRDGVVWRERCGWRSRHLS
jgi:hypothetical protein